MADIPSLNVVDVSNGNPLTGTINAINMSGSWLQDMVWWFQAEFPWAQLATTATGAMVAGTATITPPSDFILDLKDGLLVTVNSVQRRMQRVGLQNLISYSLSHTTSAAPMVYAVQGATIRMSPTPDQAYTYTLWYYQRQAALTGAAVPTFPSDLVLVEYIRIKALEWIRAVPPGAALGYANSRVTEMRKSGLGYEAESDTIPLDTRSFIPGAGSRGENSTGWMGTITGG